MEKAWLSCVVDQLGASSVTVENRRQRGCLHILVMSFCRLDDAIMSKIMACALIDFSSVFDANVVAWSIILCMSGVLVYFGGVGLALL